MKEAQFNEALENFNLIDLACKDIYKSRVPVTAVGSFFETCKALQFIRYLFGFAVIPISGFRTIIYNKKVGGAYRSTHTYPVKKPSGIDFRLSRVHNTKANLSRIFKALDFAKRRGILKAGGLHHYKRLFNRGWIHIDSRGFNARWN